MNRVLDIAYFVKQKWIKAIVKDRFRNLSGSRVIHLSTKKQEFKKNNNNFLWFTFHIIFFSLSHCFAGKLQFQGRLPQFLLLHTSHFPLVVALLQSGRGIIQEERVSTNQYGHYSFPYPIMSSLNYYHKCEKYGRFDISFEGSLPVSCTNAYWTLSPNTLLSNMHLNSCGITNVKGSMYQKRV